MARHRGTALGSRCADAQVGNFGIQWIAQPRQPFKLLAAVADAEQGPLAVGVQPAQLGVDVGVEPDHETVAAQAVTIGRIEHRATTSREYDAAAPDQLGKQGALAPAEAGLAFDLEGQGDADPGALLEGQVEVDEGQPELRREAPPDRGLAGAHRADQKEVRGRIHWGNAISVPRRLGYTARFREYPSAMLRFIIVFLLLLVVLFVAELTPFVERWVIVPFTSVLAEASAWIIHLFDGSTVSHGKLIQNANGSFIVSIERGCNGIEAVIILISAILAFPAPWKHRLVGLVFGFLAVQVLNLVRIVSLFFLGLWSHVWFEWFHLYLWQALIVLDALIVFLIWLRYIPRVPRKQGAEPAAAA